MRRLPVYFLIDISESMIGEPIRQVEDGIATIVKELKKDPYALETVYISIILFAGKAKTVVPLTDIIQFYPPRLPIGGGTSMGAAMEHIMLDMDHNLVRTTLERKGDWKPIIFLFTDGTPTDDYKKAFEKYQQQWKSRCNMVAVSFGTGTDTSLLQQLTDNVLVFKNTDAASYAQFFKWITSSIQASSMSVGMGQGDDLQLPPTEGYDIDKAPGPASAAPTRVDSNVATFLVRCQRNKSHFLVKYNRETEGREMYGLNYSASGYRLAGAYPVGQEYFDLTDKSANVNSTVSSSELIGAPNCPSCGNPYGISRCPCGQLFCADDSDSAVCPWCNQQLYAGGSGGPIDLSRTQG